MCSVWDYYISRRTIYGPPKRLLEKLLCPNIPDKETYDRV